MADLRTKAHGDALLRPPVRDRTVRSCNRHRDCDAEEAWQRERGRTHFVNFHCHDECCEECFGY